MASEFDELVEQLFYELAVAGDEGLSYNDLQRHIDEFYAAKYDNNFVPASRPDLQDLLFSESPPLSRPSTDAAVIRSHWDWLCKHKDVNVRNVVVRSDPVAREASLEVGTTQTTNPEQSEELLVESASSIDPANTIGPQRSEERIVATPERAWQALAGHGIDNSRIKNAEFVLLRIIAKHGAKGLVQPELVKQSGQDKRSVPKRTDVLAANGYILKQPVIGCGTRTSSLKLAKFADPVSAAETGHGVIYYDEWFDKTVEMLTNNDNIIATDDLRVGIGISKQTHMTRALNRCIRRLMSAGCVRRVKAKVIGKTSDERGSHVKCLQLLRTPTTADRQAFSQQPSRKQSTGPGKLRFNSNVQQRTGKDDYDGDEDDDADGESDPDADADAEFEIDFAASGKHTVQAVRTVATARIPPQWTPNIPMPNLLFDLIDTAGSEGLGTMEIHKRATGPAWRRPVDEILLRLCDQWKISQPPHLRHLGILKDTAMRLRTHYFLYRTRTAFEEAAAKGESFWEAIQTEPHAKGEKSEAEDISQFEPPDLDSWGFPKLPPHLFAGTGDGTATLDVCAKLSLSGMNPVGRPSKAADQFGISKRKRPSDERSPVASPRPHKKANLSSLNHAATTVLDDRHRTSIDGDTNASSDSSADEEGNIPAPSAQSALVQFNPSGSLRMKLDHLQLSRGRPRKHLIAVFKLSGLKAKDWFTEDQTLPRFPSLKRKQPALATASNSGKRARRNIVVDDGDDDDEVYTEGHLTSATANLQQTSMLAPPLEAPAILGEVPANHDANAEGDSEAASGRTVRQAVSTKLSGSIQFKRTKVVMDIIQQCGGIYPGNREIFTPAAAAIKEYSGTNVDIQTIYNVIKDLVSRGKLRKILFQFYDSRKYLVRRAILTEPHIQPSDPAVQELKQKIEEAYPNRYLPSPKSSGVVTANKTNGGPETSLLVQRTPKGLEMAARHREELLARYAAARKSVPLKPLRSTPSILPGRLSTTAAPSILPNRLLASATPSILSGRLSISAAPSVLPGPLANPAAPSIRPPLRAFAPNRVAFHEVIADRPEPSPQPSPAPDEEVEAATTNIHENDEVLGPSFVVTKKRDRRSPKLFQEHDRLTHAVALYRAVLGGLDQKCNWGVIAHMLSFRYEPDFLRRRWDSVKNAREDSVRIIMAGVYEPFLAAYEKGEVATINFDNLSGTDWPAMLRWLEQGVLHKGQSGSRTLLLPQLPDHFHAAYTITEPANFWERSRESWFTSPGDKSRKDIAHEFVYGTPLAGHQRPSQDHAETETTVLRTLVRAISVTKPNMYKSVEAATRLEPYQKDTVAAVCEEMIAKKILKHLNKGRQQLGRNYEINDATWAVFRRWPGKDNEWKYLRQLAIARNKIVAMLDESDVYRLDFHTPDVEVVVLTNMVQQGLIRFSSQLPERNDDFKAPFPRLSAWGYADYTYNAKTLDRERLRFPVLIEKTEKYGREHDLVPGVAIPTGATKDPDLDDGRIPFWIDIHGNLVPDIWDTVLRSVLHLVVFRTGSTVNAIEDSHNQRLASWEINLILEWMKHSGIAEHCGAGQMKNGYWAGGWMASEWWYCAFLPEMITWNVHAMSV